MMLLKKVGRCALGLLNRLYHLAIKMVSVKGFVFGLGVGLLIAEKFTSLEMILGYLALSGLFIAPREVQKARDAALGNRGPRGEQ